MSRQQSRSTWLRSGIQRAVHVLWPVALLLLDGCYNEQFDDQIGRLRNELLEQRSVHSAIEGRVRSIEEFLTYCPDEVRRLIGQVDQACEAGEYCELNEREIRLQVLDVARWNGGRFLSLMQDRKHVALFLPPEGRELRDVERKQLRDLIEPAWLDDRDRRTRFLVVSHPQGLDPAGKGQAKRRGDYVIREMMTIVGKLHPPLPSSAGTQLSAPQAVQPPSVGTVALASLHGLPLPATSAVPALTPPTIAAGSLSGPTPAAAQRPRYILHWVFPFFREGEVLRPEDRPAKAELLKSSVFVYRVEC